MSKAIERSANLPIGKLRKDVVCAHREIGVPCHVVSDANQEIGVPSPWHSRGYLPHFDGRESVQHVTFHLADSLPKETLARLHKEVEGLSEDERKRELTVRLQDWMDSGYGSCVLREAEIAEMMESVLLFFDNDRYILFEWVVMPNHVHVLFKPCQGWKVSNIVASWKKFSARKIREWHLRGNANLPIGSLPSAVWHREYWDRFMRDEAHFHRATEYIQANPVKAGLVERCDQWRWGSAYQGANREIGVPGLKTVPRHEGFEEEL